MPHILFGRTIMINQVGLPKPQFDWVSHFFSKITLQAKKIHVLDMSGCTRAILHSIYRQKYFLALSLAFANAGIAITSKEGGKSNGKVSFNDTQITTQITTWIT